MSLIVIDVVLLNTLNCLLLLIGLDEYNSLWFKIITYNLEFKT
jgi:hypothetical protein